MGRVGSRLRNGGSGIHDSPIHQAREETLKSNDQAMTYFPQ